jgi:NAD(P)-dependent dehydrogenase (short-subunit alcohol dehydrogenase family)
MTRRWFITGCSTGLGRALALAVAAAGERVVATARKPEALEELRAAYPDQVTVGALDVRDPAACLDAVRLATDRLGGIDVLVNNAGFGQLGTVEEIGDPELAAQLDTNLFGPWRLTRLFLPHFRAQGAGDIVMVSSTAARIAYPGMSAYVASKFALEGLVEALSVELAGTGVNVVSVQPGGFATEWGTSALDPLHRVTAYEPVVGPMYAGVRAMKRLPEVSSPELFASEVLRLVTGDRRPLRLPIGEDSWAVALSTTKQAHEALLALRPALTNP